MGTHHQDTGIGGRRWRELMTGSGGSTPPKASTRFPGSIFGEPEPPRSMWMELRWSLKPTDGTSGGQVSQLGIRCTYVTK